MSSHSRSTRLAWAVLLERGVLPEYRNLAEAIEAHHLEALDSLDAAIEMLQSAPRSTEPSDHPPPEGHGEAGRGKLVLLEGGKDVDGHREKWEREQLDRGHA